MPNPTPLRSQKLINLLSMLPDTVMGKLVRPAVPIVERALSLNSLNRLYLDMQRDGGEEQFIESGLNALGVRYEVSSADLERIPKTGPLVVVANHPFGLLDPMIVIALLRSVRPDVKVMTNHLLAAIPELTQRCIFVDPFGGREATRRNLAPLKEAIKWLADGGLLVIFPAGEVASFQLKTRTVVEPRWNEIVAALIRKSGASTLPLFVKGTNTPGWHLAGLVHPKLRTALLMRELANKRQMKIEVYAGKPLPWSKLKALESDGAVIDYIRARTFNLRNRRAKASEPVWVGAPRPAVVTTPAAGSMELVRREVATLPAHCRLADAEGLAVYLARPREIPLALKEIGRQREIAFRAVGEGTGNELDLDKFDQHYLQLFLWDERAGEIAGGYRIGQSDEILPRFGAQGLYTTTLFHMNRALLLHLTPALELGRSFVRQEYQKTTTALALLWKGIGSFVAENPRYRLLFGPVSISGDYRPGSQELMIRFLRENCLEAERTRFVKARNPLKLKGRVACPAGCDLNEISHRVADIEADEKGVPVLVRQYLNLGGKILGFNVDPAFNHAIDVLIVVDLLRTDPRILGRFMGRAETDRFLSAHDVQRKVKAASAVI